MDPFTVTAIVLKIKSFFGKLFKSKWFWIALITITVSVGGYIAFHKYVGNKVETAVVSDRKDSTIQTYKAKDKVDSTTAPIDRKYDRIRDQTIKDFANVRVQIQTSEPSQREAPAPDLIIDTLNAIDRVRASGPADSVPDATHPVG